MDWTADAANIACIVVFEVQFLMGRNSYKYSTSGWFSLMPSSLLADECQYDTLYWAFLFFTDNAEGCEQISVGMYLASLYLLVQ